MFRSIKKTIKAAANKVGESFSTCSCGVRFDKVKIKDMAPDVKFIEKSGSNYIFSIDGKREVSTEDYVFFCQGCGYMKWKTTRY